MADRIVLNSISYHGKGAIENIVPELQNRGKKKVLVCTDASLLKFGVAQKVTDLLDKAGMAYDIYSDIKPNPTIENVQHGVAAFQKAEAHSIPSTSPAVIPLMAWPISAPMPKKPASARVTSKKMTMNAVR